MNAEQVKEFLCKIRKPKKDFTVEFTNKSNKRTHGLYYPGEMHIKINNLNFVNESTMLYTAIHEYAHHLQFLRDDRTGHNRAFWRIFHDLVDEAERQGIYTPPPVSNKMLEVEDDIKKLLAERTELEKRIGEKMCELHREAEEAGSRIEYVIERRIKEDMKTTRDLEILSNLPDSDVPLNTEQALVIMKKGFPAQQAILAGKTLVQAQTAEVSQDEEDPYERLKKEKEKVVKKIDRLQYRKEELSEKIEQFEFQFGGTAEKNTA